MNSAFSSLLSASDSVTTQEMAARKLERLCVEAEVSSEDPRAVVKFLVHEIRIVADTLRNRKVDGETDGKKKTRLDPMSINNLFDPPTYKFEQDFVPPPVSSLMAHHQAPSYSPQEQFSPQVVQRPILRDPFEPSKSKEYMWEVATPVQFEKTKRAREEENGYVEHQSPSVPRELEISGVPIALDLCGTTRFSYARIARRFISWCESKGMASFPVTPELIERWFSSLSGVSRSSHVVYIAAINAYQEGMITKLMRTKEAAQGTSSS